MNYKVIVSPIASKNIEDAVEYYSQKVSQKVALDFLNDYKMTYKALQKNPFIDFTITIIDLYLLANFLILLFLFLTNLVKLFS